MDRASDARLRIARAEEQLRALQAELEAFFATNPYRVDTKRDPDSRRLMYYLAAVHPPPDRIALIAGDVLQNLRTALDYLAYQLVLAGSRSTTPLTYVYFPIGESAAKYRSLKGSYLKGATREAMQVIDALRPYKGGDDALWQLHRLNVIDKHRLLVAVGSTYRSLDLGGFMARKLARDVSFDLDISDLSLFFKPEDRLCPLTAGDDLFTDLPDAEVDKQLEFRFDLALHEPGIVDGEPLLERLELIRNSVAAALERVAVLF